MYCARFDTAKFFSAIFYKAAIANSVPCVVVLALIPGNSAATSAIIVPTENFFDYFILIHFPLLVMARSAPGVASLVCALSPEHRDRGLWLQSSLDACVISLSSYEGRHG